MNKLFDTFIPDGFSTVSTYLFVNNAPDYIAFLKTVFHANELSRTTQDEGRIANCILKIGNTNIMISQATGPFENLKTALYLYVNDVDKAYDQAIKEGCKSVFEAADMDYGDRQAGVQDKQGNYWWISTRKIATNY